MASPWPHPSARGGVVIPSLVYAPEVTIHIETAKSSKGKGKVIDVSEDISSGSVTRIRNGLSTADVTLLNQGRKYDDMFTPMDKIIVRLRRLDAPILKFSGYLDSVPLWSAEPGSVHLTASCTLKRLQNFMWDPTSSAGAMLLNTPIANANRMEDGGVAQRAISVLTEVAGWAKGQIHISRIPHNWYDTVASVADKLIAESETLSMASAVGSGAWVGGANPVGDLASSTTGVGPGTGTMPATSGKCSSFGGPNGGAYGSMALTGESGVHPRDNWYCAMRWPYVNDDLSRKPGVDTGKAKTWWANRHIEVVNPKNNKAIVVRAVDWGPNINTGRVIDLAPHALKALGASTDDVLHMGFAPKNSSVGVVKGSHQADFGAALDNRGMSSGGGASAVTSGWGAAGDRSNMVQARAKGLSWTCHRLAKRNFEGFVNDLVDQLGYHPKTIGGFRASGGIGGPMNHGYGAAIDIDAAKNPYFSSARGGKYAIPGPPDIINLARKWGLGWGGEYRNSKDYMHFEVIGAPYSNAAAYKGAKTGAGTGTVVVKKWKPPVTGYVITCHFGDGGNHWVSGTHSGTDFAVPAHTPIHPVGPGVVHDHGTGDKDYGNWVSIDHGNKVYTFYAHMIAPSPVPVGTRVTTSSVIGHVGQTGNATGPHVHLELRKGADTYTAATKSGGIEKYVLGGAKRSDPPAGTDAVQGDYGSSDATGTGTDVAQSGQGLFNVFQYAAQKTTHEGMVLGGYRALLNDVPVLETVGQLMQAAMRDFCSAPNGDFIAWFPDFFGHYKQAGKMVITPLEIMQEGGPPTIGWDDTNLKTHQFVAGSTSFGSGDAVNRTAMTAGIASVEFPELMMALFDMDKRQAENMRDDYLKRFGARPEFTPMDQITGARQEFFFACYLFQQNWSQQFQANVNLTFMPELFPGMLACFPEYGIQGYVVQTTDSFDLAGGGFSTSVVCAPWSSIGKNSVAGSLPKGAPL